MIEPELRKTRVPKKEDSSEPEVEHYGDERYPGNRAWFEKLDRASRHPEEFRDE